MTGLRSGAYNSFHCSFSSKKEAPMTGNGHDAPSSLTVNRDSRRALSRVDVHVTTNFGLTGENVPLSLILLGERILHGHAHIPRQELNAARCTCARAAGVVDENARFVSHVEDSRIGPRRCARVRSLKDYRAGDCG